MDAGRELDALVAEKAMHWRSVQRRGAGDTFYVDGIDPQTDEGDVVPYFSTDISAAWPVAELLQLWVFPHEGRWYAGHILAEAYTRTPLSERAIVDGGFAILEGAETAPLAICRAALAAVGAEVPG